VDRRRIISKGGGRKKDCKQGRWTEEHSKLPGAKTVRATDESVPRSTVSKEDPYSFLDSFSDEGVAEDDTGVLQVRVKDDAQCIKLSLQGVPVYGIVESGADITIISGQLFKRAALAAHLKKDFMKPDKTPRPYDQKPFTL